MKSTVVDTVQGYKYKCRNGLGLDTIMISGTIYDANNSFDFELGTN